MKKKTVNKIRIYKCDTDLYDMDGVRVFTAGQTYHRTKHPHLEFINDIGQKNGITEWAKHFKEQEGV